MNVITVKAPAPLVGLYRFVEQPSFAFDADFFNIEALQTRGLLDGMANAGRGNTAFLNLHDQKLVLRHYHRGGLVRHISKARYVFLGMERTRAFKEFEILLHLQRVGLRAPKPFACQVLRHGLWYTASLITHRLSGHTVAECMQGVQPVAGNRTENQSHSVAIDDSIWRSVGDAIASFHQAGIYHADLNAHNIMVGDDGQVALIDFDRSRLRALPVTPTLNGWCVGNMDRLERSIAKVATSESCATPMAGQYAELFSICRQQWAESMQNFSDAT